MNLSPDTEKHNAYLKSLAPLDPRSIPFVNIPSPSSAAAHCSVSLIRTGNLTKFPSWFILEGENPDATRSLPCTCFLIEKKETDGTVTRVLFELGLRDVKAHTKPTYKRYASIWGGAYLSGVAATLQKNGISPNSISTVILGHTHFDHIGDFASLPAASLVLGTGSSRGAALADELDIPLSILEKRTVKTLSRTHDEWCTVGCLDGVDYFEDGSLWLLDTPGHKVGHLTALVRTSTTPPVYHLLGSDTCHSLALISPPVSSSSSSPQGTPTSLPSPRAGLFPLTEFIPDYPDREYLTSMHDDLAEAYASMAKVGRMDLAENVNLFLSHDASMDVLFPGRSDQIGNFEFVRMDGGIEELKRLKARDRSVTVPLPLPH